MDFERRKRKEEIERALKFIQSSLPYPDPEGYEAFLAQLVCNLLDEGNTAFWERDWTLARMHFSEGVSVACYAQAEGVTLPPALLESLYVNRAATHHSMGDYVGCVRDCDSALSVCASSRKALFRKAVCLRDLGQLREAYDCSAACLRISPEDKQVNELAQDLASKLNLRNRKAYISPQKPGAESHGDLSPPLEQILSDGLDSMDRLSDISVPLSPLLIAEPVSDQSAVPVVGVGEQGVLPSAAVPVSVPISEPLTDADLVGDELDSLLDCMSKQQHSSTEPPVGVVCTGAPRAAIGLGPAFSPSLPPPSLHLPPAFFTSALSQLNSLDSISHPGHKSPRPHSTPLDALDSFSPQGGAQQGVEARGPPAAVGGGGLDSLSEFSLPGGRCQSFLQSVSVRSSAVSLCAQNGQVTSTLTLMSQNPLANTHDFTQACSTCYIHTGSGVLDYVRVNDSTHHCKKDILLCRRKDPTPNLTWKRIRPRPTRNNFLGAYVLCKEVQEFQQCKYRDGCTFAFYQEEIDVWTQERRGLLTRELLFSPLSANQRRARTVAKLLQIHSGMFMFLCEVCFDGNPRVISKRSKQNLSFCSNPVAHHAFDKHRCLVHTVKSSSGVRYSKVRPLGEECQMDVCKLRFCRQDNKCSFAHSLIELETWLLQQDTGITHEEIVQESKKHWHKLEHNTPRLKTVSSVKASIVSKNSAINGPGSAVAGGGSDGQVKGQGLHHLQLKMKFVCGQCWTDGLLSEPDKTLKYCSSKARHSWTKERRTLLVKSMERKKWVAVRPLPYAKTNPQQYDICVHVLKQRKCHYIGNCTFAHSQEERDMWTYMKNNGLRDIQQMYDLWLEAANQNCQPDVTALSQPIEEKQITMPTDFAEPLSGFYCHLCGKQSNSERQWCQHVSSEKHKDRVFSGQGEELTLTWTHRFPGHCFTLCPSLDDCPEGVSCDFAHSEAELEEWQERRDFLRRKLAKARADMLILPSDCDFGKYNFLLQD
ncbi:zinc finger CCCH-type containing 7Ba [Chanos chanos]|uniref:Zinc finger CCCH-type containing 7Ba n=1 Tax=Chanos chanos TaxID=29144 RepID=A0A6J2X039_CHACN|nr:zinc finger CCCH domain-containing protein 7B-like [Chanos chanos]